MRKGLFGIIFIVFLFLPCFFVGAVSLGEKANFYIDSSYDLTGRSQVSATLKKIGETAYFYMDESWWNGLSSQEQVQNFNSLNNLAEEFDKRIYPELRKTFGSEWRPGIDNDERITILIHPLVSEAGSYFNTSDEYPRSKIPRSNEREMIYLNAKYLNSPLAKSFLAHEFQHLISFYQKDKLRGVSEEIWLNEARSEYAPTLLGYDDEYSGSNLEKRIKNFLDKPYDSLTEWANTGHDYGVVNLFIQYVVDHYGVNLLVESLKSSETGIKSLNTALKNLGHDRDFSKIFTDWTIAAYVNDCALGPGFCYKSGNLKKFKVTPLANFIPFVGKSSFSIINTTKDWAGNWYKFSGGHSVLKIEFQGLSGTNFQVPYVVTGSDGKNSLDFFSLDNSQKGTIYISNFGTKNISLVIIPSIQQKTSDFSDKEPIYQFSWTASTVDISEIPPVSNPIFDGSLIRAKGDFKVYVVKGKYRRWIQSPEIFNMYGHLRWENIIEVSQKELLNYQESFLVREKDDYRVYKIEGAPLDSSGHLTPLESFSLTGLAEQAKKRWLNMTAWDFEARGYKWDEIFIINQKERDYFPIGAPIL